MDRRQLAQSHGDCPGDQRAQHEGENDGRPGNLYGRAGTEQKSGANGASNSHHSHLSGG